MAELKSPFNEWIEKLLNVEGGYSNRLNDRGGETIFGITRKLALYWKQRDLPALAMWNGEMREFHLDMAVAIYRQEFWVPLRLERLARWNKPIAFEIGDSAVNCGRKSAVLFLQRALNLLNWNGRRWIDVKEDGDLGEITIGVVERIQDKDRQRQLLRALDGEQYSHYAALTRADPSQEENFAGWLDKRIGNEVIL